MAVWRGVYINEPQDIEEIANDARLRALDKEKCWKDPVYFMFNYAYTFDETNLEEPVRRFPRKQYLLLMLQQMMRNQKVVVAKSRQVMISWLSCWFSLWFAISGNHRRVLIQSKKQEDADALLERVWHMYRLLPKWLKAGKAKPMTSRLKFFKIHSEIKALPQGADNVRSYTPSLIFMDEVQLQDEAEGAYSAAQPMIRGGAKFLGVGTACGGTFLEKLYKDRLKNDNNTGPYRKQLMTGLHAGVGKHGVMTVRLHYSADTVKHTPQYIAELRASMPDWMFEQEMEIDFTARGGQPVYNMFDKEVHVKTQTIDPSWQRYGALDHGRHNPTAFADIYVDRHNNLYVADEYYQGNQTVQTNCRAMRKQFGNHAGEMPHLQIFGDPSIWKKVPDAESTVADIYSENGVLLDKADNAIDAGIELVSRYLISGLAKWSLEFGVIHPHFKNSELKTKEIWQIIKKVAEHPSITFSARAEHCWTELRNMKFKERKNAADMNQPEKPEERNDHAADAIRYACMANIMYSKEVFGGYAEGTYGEMWERVKNKRKKQEAEFR